jgi:hypothetical protein
MIMNYNIYVYRYTYIYILLGNQTPSYLIHNMGYGWLCGNLLKKICLFVFNPKTFEGFWFPRYILIYILYNRK